jgi:hypothetical protein
LASWSDLTVGKVVPIVSLYYREDGASSTLLRVLEIDAESGRALVEYVVDDVREWLPLSEWVPLDNPDVLVPFDPSSAGAIGRLTALPLVATASRLLARARRASGRFAALLLPFLRRTRRFDTTHVLLRFESVSAPDRTKRYVATASLADFLSRRLDARGFVTLRRSSAELSHEIAIVSTGRQFLLSLDPDDRPGVWSLRVTERDVSLARALRPAVSLSPLNARLADETEDVLSRSGEYRSLRREVIFPEE